MERLFCDETDIGEVDSQEHSSEIQLYPPKRAFKNSSMLNDDRLLRNLLNREDSYLPSTSYFVFQDDIRPFMRNVLAKWMLDVCEEQHQEEEVFPLAVNLLDRFLMVVQTKSKRLQLVGCVCMFIASKLMDTKPLSAVTLVMYTEYSVSANEILEWELLVLQVLRFDVCAITPHDFVDLLLARIPIPNEHSMIVRQHTVTFIALCTTESSFVMRPPSLIASASICAAVSGVDKNSCDAVVHELHAVTSIDEDCIRCCHEQIERLVAASFAAVHFPPVSTNQNAALPSGKSVVESGVELRTTPTDIREVHPQ